MRTNVRSGRRGCPRGQRVGALLSNLLIAGMRTCCAPFTPLAGKSRCADASRRDRSLATRFLFNLGSVRALEPATDSGSGLSCAGEKRCWLVGAPRELLPGLLMLSPCALRNTPGCTRCPLLRTGRAWAVQWFDVRGHELGHAD